MSGHSNDPNHPARFYRKSFDGALSRHVKRFQSLYPKLCVVLAGDLNVAHRDRDKWDARDQKAHMHPSFRPDERRRFSDLLKDRQLTDVFVRLQENNSYSHFTYYFSKKQKTLNRGLRIDYVLAKGCL
jgi:exonuclease III